MNIYIKVDDETHAARGLRTVEDWGALPQPGDYIALRTGDYLVQTRRFVSDTTGDSVELFCTRPPQ